MTAHAMFFWEVLQFAVSLIGLVLSVLVAKGAWQDWREARDAGDNLSEHAQEMAKERLITGLFLLWMASCLALSSVYALALSETLSAMAQVFGRTHIQVQALALRVVWRASVTAFAFVRWSTREHIRRELNLK